MRKPIQNILLGAIVAATGISAADAAVSVTDTPSTWSWTSHPLRGDWLSYPLAGDQGDITSLSQLNAVINSISHETTLEGGFNTDQMNGSTSTPGNVNTNDLLSRNSRGRYNSAEEFFQFALGGGGSAGALLQARLRNQSGAPLEVLELSFDLGRHIPLEGVGIDGGGDGVVGPLPGISVYYSMSGTGAEDSWHLVPGWSAVDTTAELSLGQFQTFTTQINFQALHSASIAPGGDFYIRWVVDNANGEDYQYALDNHTFTAVPEPSAGLLAAAAAAGLGFIRRRRK